MLNKNYKQQRDIPSKKLSVGNKNLVSSQTPNYSTNNFRVQVVDNLKYTDFICEGGDQAGSYLKVTELIEGTETDSGFGTIKTLEATFDLDIKMYPGREPRPTSPAKLKGILRMKYREIK